MQGLGGGEGSVGRAVLRGYSRVGAAPLIFVIYSSSHPDMLTYTSRTARTTVRFTIIVFLSGKSDRK